MAIRSAHPVALQAAPASSPVVRDQSILHARHLAASQDPAVLALVQALVPAPDLARRAPVASAAHVLARAVLRLPVKHHARNVPLLEDAVDARSIPRPRKAR